MNVVSEEVDRIGAAVPSKNNSIIFSLPRSPDFSLMQEIAAVITKKPRTGLKSAIQKCHLEKEIKYVFSDENSSVTCCQFYVGSTLVATGRGGDAKRAQERAVQYGHEILTNLSNLPYKTIEDVKQELENWKKDNWIYSIMWPKMSSSDMELKSKITSYILPELEKNPTYADLCFILGIVEKLLDEKYIKNQHMCGLEKIEVVTKLNCISEVYFFHFSENPFTSLEGRLFRCDFVIKNIFICQSEASTKMKAKIFAAEQGFSLLVNLIENANLKKYQNDQEPMPTLETNFDSLQIKHSRKRSISMVNGEQSTDMEIELDNRFLKKSKTDASTMTSDPSPECFSSFIDSASNLKSFRKNLKLLNKSIKLQLVVFVSSRTQNDASSIIWDTALKCQKDLIYETEMCPTRYLSEKFSCSITLNEKRIGEAMGRTMIKAQSMAAREALKFLQSRVYTIKIKNDSEKLQRNIKPMDLLSSLIQAGGSTDKYELEDNFVSR